MGILKLMGYEAWSSPKPVEEKSLVLGTSNALGNFLIFGQGGANTAAGALDLYRKSTAVSVPVNRIAMAISTMGVVLEMEDGNIINQHPALDLLRNPSPYYNRALFMEMMAKNYLITNETEVVAIGSITRPPIELQPISPDKITVIESSEGLAGSHIITGNTLPGNYGAEQDSGRVRYIRDGFTEAILIRGFKTRNNSLLRGESLLVSAASEVRQHILGGEHNVSILEKGGRVSLIFHFNQDMSNEDFETTKQRVREQYGGAEKAGQIGVTAGKDSLTVSEIGTNNKDMDFAQLQKMAKIAVANQYGYPLLLLDSDAMTMNNYQTAKEALYDDAALPVANAILGGLSDFLLPRFNIDPSKIRLVPDMDSITALATRRNTELKLRKDIGIETINELRKFLPNREGVDNGDNVLVPANLIPLDSVTGFNTVDDNPSAFTEE